MTVQGDLFAPRGHPCQQECGRDAEHELVGNQFGGGTINTGKYPDMRCVYLVCTPCRRLLAREIGGVFR